MSPDWIENLSRTFGPEIALEDSDAGVQIRYRELPDLLRKHAPAGTRAGIFLTREPNSLPHALSLVAAGFSGWTVFPVNPRWPRNKTMQILEKWGFGTEAEPLWNEGRASAPGGPGRGTLLASSGSSGPPKVVFHPWFAHSSNAAGAAARIPLRPGRRWHIDLPLWHTSGFAAFFRTLQSGATAVFGSQPTGITHRSIVATQLWRGLENGSLVPGTLSALLAGGGPVPCFLRAAALEKGLPLFVTYGLTEAASQVTTSEQLRTSSPETCGSALPNREIHINPNQEILLRGAVLASGHWLQSQQNLTALPVDENGWWATGDLGRLHPAGELEITGRKDRMFICGGENLQPEQIERVLVGLPGIRQAMVLPVADPEFGSIPVAFVDGRGDVATWKEILEEQLSGLEIPRRWYAWPDQTSPGNLSLKPAVEIFRDLLAGDMVKAL